MGGVRMDELRYPKDLVVTVDDFNASGWESIAEEAGCYGYTSYHSSFSTAARKSMEAGNTSKGKVLWLIADACSLMLKPNRTSDPFQPLMVMQDGRSAIVDDFLEQDLVFFENILPNLSDFRLTARLADILWVARRPKNVQHALIAIDAYQEFSLEPDNILTDSREAWERAIRLSIMLGKGADSRLEIIRNKLLTIFEESDFSSRFHALWLSDLLEIADLEKDESKKVTSKLESFSEMAGKTDDWNCAREYLTSAIKWHRKIGNTKDVCRLTVKKAEAWVSEADLKSKSNMVAGHFLENAIKTYREIPSADRPNYDVDSRIKDLHQRMSKANILALDEMGMIECPGVDISKYIEASRKHVRGRKFPEVLQAFANVSSGVNFEEIQKNASENINNSLVHLLFSSTHFSRDGRVAARSPGIDIGNPESESTKQAIWQQMIQNYTIHIGLAVQANIIPAFQALIAEHRLTEGIMVSLCRNSHAIPIGREQLWAKGLYYGFEQDFIISIHLLIPQLEHFVRSIMKQHGLKTTTLDSRGIETENGLSTLLDNSEIDKYLGADFTFELRALLAHSIGPNLRNEVAHGLLEADAAMSAYSIYFWWLCLRIVVNSIPWTQTETSSKQQGTESN